MTRPSPGPGKSIWGLDQNLAAGLTYLLGLITGVIFLIAEPENKFVRFHALQSTYTFGAVAIAWLMLLGLPVLGMILVIPFVIGVTVLWVFLMFKAVSGERYKLKFIGDWVEGQLK